MISTLPPPPRLPINFRLPSAPGMPRAAEDGEAPRPASVRQVPVRYPSLQALLLSASHAARLRNDAVSPYTDRISGLIGFRVGERVLVLDRGALDRALRDPSLSAITSLITGKDGWSVVARLLAEGWRPPTTSDR